jgi:hypothetical protein
VQFAEFEPVSTREQLRQGDVIEATDDDAPMWRRHLVVITADCDLAFDKHHGRITAVPLLHQTEYLLEMQFPRIRDRSVQKALKALRSQLTGTAHERLSDDGALRWLREATPEEISVELGFDGTKATNVKNALEALDLLSRVPSNLAHAVQLQAEGLVALGLSESNARKEVTLRLKQSFTQTPGDALFLSSIGPGLTEGYFAFLRHLEQIPEPDIALAATRQPAKYRRVARLTDRYAHALVQRFAMVFLAIGLPADYEETRDFHSELLEEQLN